MKHNILCKNTCCCLSTETYIPKPTPPTMYNQTKRTPKAGMFIYDPNKGKVLIVQSRGQKWGPPKGGMESCDLGDLKQCAIREVHEETGILVPKDKLGKSMKINQCTYYIVPFDERECNTLPMNDNDATGIGWIHPNCLTQLYIERLVDLNVHCKKLIRAFLN
jgi:8-oxo-dGTP pyrophosphatase MutT (NUDIX family)